MKLEDKALKLGLNGLLTLMSIIIWMKGKGIWKECKEDLKIDESLFDVDGQ